MPVVWRDEITDTFVGGYLVAFPKAESDDELLERFFGTKPSTWATDPEDIRAAYDADHLVQADRKASEPGPLLALKHSIEDGIADSIQWIPPCRRTTRPATPTAYGLYRVEPLGDHDSYADVEREPSYTAPDAGTLLNAAEVLGWAEGTWVIERVMDAKPLKASFLPTLPKLTPGSRFKLQTGRYTPLAGRFIWTTDRHASWVSGEPGELMEVARVARLENRDGFEWRVFDTTTDESIDALADPTRALPLPPGFPLPVPYGRGVGASPWLLAKWQRERDALAVARVITDAGTFGEDTTPNFEYGLAIARRMQSYHYIGEPLPDDARGIAQLVMGVAAAALVGGGLLWLIAGHLLTR